MKMRANLDAIGERIGEHLGLEYRGCNTGEHKYVSALLFTHSKLGDGWAFFVTSELESYNENDLYMAIVENLETQIKAGEFEQYPPLCRPLQIKEDTETDALT
jgi:hypothetical protein